MPPRPDPSPSFPATAVAPDWLDACLQAQAQADALLPDDGFSTRLLARLPPPAPSPVPHRWPQWLLGLGLGGLVVLMLGLIPMALPLIGEGWQAPVWGLWTVWALLSWWSLEWLRHIAPSPMGV